MGRYRRAGCRLKRSVRRIGRLLSRRGRMPPARRRRGSTSTAPRIASAFVNVEIAVSFSLFALCYGGLPFGIEAMGVATSSMEPAIPAGSLAFVRHVSSDEPSVNPGDVVAFSVGEGERRATVLHRIERVHPERGTIATKGDANSASDPFEVPIESIIGTLEGSLPCVGGALEALSKHKLVALISIAAVNAAALAAAYAPLSRHRHRTDWSSSCTIPKRALRNECP